MFRSILVALSVIVAIPFCIADETPKATTHKKDAAKKAAPKKKKDWKVERTRREVRMLDDIYKGGIVTITEHYVTEEDQIPAGTAFKKLFIAAEKKGWHRVRLVDATGSPYDDVNVAEDKFEKAAVKQLVAGKPWVEEIEVREGVRHLRVATPIPVVFEKCIMCHDNYADVPKGGAIGALTYVVPIDGKLVSKLSPKAKAKAKPKKPASK